ncbi:TIM barrel protein [Candidatus Poribacteria bacterium]|nr:TIM barrel protein [Candidatus Poribacteria bacterium]
MSMEMGFIGNNSLEDVKADAKFSEENGFAALEYNYWGNFKDLTQETVEKMREILDDHNIEVSSLGIWGWNHMAKDTSERETAHEMLKRAIKFGKILRAHILVAGGGDIEGASLDKKVEEFSKVFPPFLEEIEKAGMKIAMYAVHGNSFFDSIQAYEKVWEKFPNVGVKYDPANWCHHGDDYLALPRLHGDKIYHFHIKEHIYHDGQLVSQPAAGMGDIHWGKLMAYLYEHDYQGYLSIEPHGPIWSRGEMRDKMLLLTKKYMSQFLL